MSEGESSLDKEIRSLANHIWVVSKMPKGGPEQFLAKAEQIIRRRGFYRVDAINDAAPRQKKGREST